MEQVLASYEGENLTTVVQEDSLMRRKGRLEVSEVALRYYTDQVLKSFLKLQILPLRVDRTWDKDTTEFMFISPNVRPIKEGERIPFYKLSEEDSPTLTEVTGR